MNRVALKLGASLALILGVGALPANHALWGLCALPLLLLGALSAKVAWRALLTRLAMALPFVLGVACLALFGHAGLERFLALLVKSSVSILTLQLLTQTTPLSALLRALRRAHVPEVLCGTISLLYRYLFVMADESKRMRRARAGRTLRSSRLSLWRALGNSIGLLFVRTVSRAERVHAAMRSRGGA
ncbi:MAG TPA: cobalt ECF transporter T component CbiQ [Polyangiaceae bacterium]|jgi:cobalt/nickel transport system permease protein|nr:cobalt ECF transporter T component CbiQ [Polyangiaceae bacterium]